MSGLARRGQRGQSLVEFALTAPIALLLMFGLVEGARATWQYNSLAHATREGTRYAITHGAASADASGPGNTGDVVVVVRDSSSPLNQSALNVMVTYPDGSNRRGDKVRVESRYSFAPMLGLLPRVTMSSTSRMTIMQ